MINNVDGWKLSRLLRSKDKRIIMHFSRAAAACMESYIKTTLKRNTNKVILHIGTSELRSIKEPLEITSIIIEKNEQKMVVMQLYRKFYRGATS